MRKLMNYLTKKYNRMNELSSLMDDQDKKLAFETSLVLIAGLSFLAVFIDDVFKGKENIGLLILSLPLIFWGSLGWLAVYRHVDSESEK